jgi:ABC-type lipoprotein export system ATPase subunit
MIRIRGLEFAYPGEEFRLNMSAFQVAHGEKLAVIGPSGSGKTTLLNLIAGIATPRAGEVRVDEIIVSELNDAQRRAFRIRQIGFVFQDFELLDYLSVLDNILHPYRITSALRLDSAVRQRAAELAASMGIADKTHRRPAELSQGERQRVAICRAMLTEPRLILADEATGNLDPVNKDHILDLLFASAAVRRATLVAVTHDHDLLPRFDRVVDFADFTPRISV